SDFDETYAHDPVLGSFLLVYVIGFGISLATLAWRSSALARRVARTEPRKPWLRRGLRTSATGAVIALGYCVGKTGLVAGSWLGAHPTVFSRGGIVGACAGALIIAPGLTMPSWGPHLTAARQWFGRARSYRRLYPLWKLIYDAVPDVALQPRISRAQDL